MEVDRIGSPYRTNCTTGHNTIFSHIFNDVSYSKQVRKVSFALFLSLGVCGNFSIGLMSHKFVVKGHSILVLTACKYCMKFNYSFD